MFIISVLSLSHVYILSLRPFFAVQGRIHLYNGNKEVFFWLPITNFITTFN